MGQRGGGSIYGFEGRICGVMGDNIWVRGGGGVMSGVMCELGGGGGGVMYGLGVMYE